MKRLAAATEPDIAATAALIGDPSRAAILSMLADGRAMPAGELARAARVSPQTASAHLDRLFKGKLISVEVQGRHHYYRLRDSHVAELLESLSAISFSAQAATRADDERTRQLRVARSCYGHLAGKLGVAITRSLCARDFLSDEDAGFRVTDNGAAWLRGIGIDVCALKGRPLARRCLDWSERRHHLSGAVGVALMNRAFELNWIARVPASRALRVTDRGRTALRAEFEIEV